MERGLTPSRERAQALILAGKVLVDDQKIDKAGASVDLDASIRLLAPDLRYVSRGGLKLEKAIDHWKIDLRGKICLDIGTSTGGFTDCMLQNGAASVFAVDTGAGQIDFKLRNDARVYLLEKTNARYLKATDLSAPIDFIAVDVSFISATLVLPPVLRAAFGDRPLSAAARWEASLVVLVKPQFEVGRERVGKGGIVRDEEAQRASVEKIKQALMDLGVGHLDWIESPILGTEGNREFLLHGWI